MVSNESNDVIEEVTTDTLEKPIEEKNKSEEELENHKKVENAVEADDKIGETNCGQENDRSEVREQVVLEQVVHEHDANIEKEQTDNTAVAAQSSRENQVPPVVMIHATAVIDDSPNAALTNDDINSLAKIIGSKDHLVNNVANFNYSYLSTKELRTKFKHTVGLVIHVKTCNLWEGARSYIWKHLGQDTWTLRNGSEVNIVKIHQK